MFAAITPALISGAVADRMKFSAWALFVPLWLFLVYVPIFKWVFGGWLGQRGSLDFAGGTAIHVNAGIAVAGRRARARQAQGLAAARPAAALDAARDDRHRHPVVRLVRLQRRLGARRQRPGRAGVHEHVPRRRRGRAACGSLVEWLRDGHPTNLGAASGIVAGLVAITPAPASCPARPARSSAPSPVLVCCYAVKVKFKAGYDDALDVVGVHFVGGLVGSLLIGFFANPELLRRSASRRASSTAAASSLLGEQVLANGVPSCGPSPSRSAS